ncbi:MAG: four helix bundle protein [Fibrobacter sp.]|nr:four helix bundle protein [Fibrobacter sp.]
MRTHKDLAVWQRAIELLVDVYQITKSFPKEKIYGLVPQMRRAAVSIPTNIAEGADRQIKKEFYQFIHISIGSLSAPETHFIIAIRLSYCLKEQGDEMLPKLDTIRRMLFGLLQHCRTAINVMRSQRMSRYLSLVTRYNSLEVL